MGAVRLSGGKKVFGRQGQALGRHAAFCNPDNTPLPCQSLQRGLDGCGQLRHGEQAEFIPPGKAQDGGTLHPRRKILRPHSASSSITSTASKRRLSDRGRDRQTHSPSRKTLPVPARSWRSIVSMRASEISRSGRRNFSRTSTASCRRRIHPSLRRIFRMYFC